MEMELELEMEMEKRATETQPRAEGGRREAGDEREQPGKTEKTEKGGRRDATSSTDGGGGGDSTRGGGGVAAGANERTPSSTEKKEARIRGENGLQEMKIEEGILEAPLHWGEQMPAPGGDRPHLKR